MRTGEVVRCRNAFSRDEGTIGTATHSDILRLNLQLLHSFENVLNAFFVILSQRISNVAIYVGDGQLNACLRILRLYIFYSMTDELLACFIHLLVVVADFDIQLSLRSVGMQSLHPNEAFRALSVLRSLHSVEAVDDIHSYQRRINEGVLSRHRMSSYALNSNVSAACVKGLVNNLAQLAAVNGISKFNRELAEVHLLRTAQANLFVRNEGNINLAMRTAFLNQGFQSNHDVSHSSLVICTQHRGTVAGNQVAANIFVQLRMLANLNVDLLVSIQQHIAALIILHNLRMNLRRKVYINSIHVANPAYIRHRSMTGRQISRQTTGQHAELADFQINQTQLSQILLQKLCHIPLTGSTRNNSAALLALRGYSSITQKTFSQTFL